MTKEELERMFKAETGIQKRHEPQEYLNWVEEKLIKKMDEIYGIKTLFNHKDNSGRK